VEKDDFDFLNSEDDDKAKPVEFYEGTALAETKRAECEGSEVM
jgi:hypothetical protein